MNELPTLKEMLDAQKAKFIKIRLEMFNWDFDETAKSLGISRKSLWENRLRYGIESPR
jgi:DNA-binding NtrC family response regulator